MRDYLIDLWRSPPAHVCVWLLVWVVTHEMPW
jgi:hypothetical protein